MFIKYDFSLIIKLTQIHTDSHKAREHWRESTGFTMSVGRLAEPPKPSFLLLSKVSQSHPFMCNACKPVHSDTTAQRRDMGARMGCYQNGSEQTSTTGQQQYSKYQYPTMTGAAGAARAVDTEEGRGTTRRAVSQRKRLQRRAARPVLTRHGQAFACGRVSRGSCAKPGWYAGENTEPSTGIFFFSN